MNQDETYMHLALQMARATSGQTSPNPMVGAVIVRDNQVVGLGAHLRAGEAHAEVHALAMAKEQAQGATLYVTLEPCSHHGRTPPCVEQVIAAGISKVCIATLDPNPLVAGRGVERLKEAGIQVEVGLLGEEAKELNECFNYYITHKKPFVTLKTATTLDGKIATVTGESKWITSQEARADAHFLRHTHDAILVGVNTVLADDPQLTTRLPGGGRHPLRIILDSHLKTPLAANILDTSVAPTWIFTNDTVDEERIKAYQAKGVRVWRTSSTERVSIAEVLKILGEQEITSLLVEGGGEVNAAFLQGNYVNKVVAYLAPTLIGGNQAPTSFRGEGFIRLAEAPSLQRVTYVPLGNNLKVIGYLK